MKHRTPSAALLQFAIGILCLGVQGAIPGDPPLTGPTLSDTAPSVLRVFGALVLVIGVLFGGVLLLKNWQRFASPKGQTSNLRILEMRSLGHRHFVYVLAYQQQRLLVSTSTTGVALLCHLPNSETPEVDLQPGPDFRPNFTLALQQMLRRKA